MHGGDEMRMSAQERGPVRGGVPPRNGRVRGAVDKAWLKELPQFCDTSVVSKVFGISPGAARSWMSGDDHILPSARRPDGRYVTAREHVVALAQRLYGEMGS